MTAMKMVLIAKGLGFSLTESAKLAWIHHPAGDVRTAVQHVFSALGYRKYTDVDVLECWEH